MPEEILSARVNDLEIRVATLEQKLDALITTYNKYEEDTDESLKTLGNMDRCTNDRITKIFNEISCIKNDLSKKGDSDEYSRFLHIIERLLDLKVDKEYVWMDDEED